MTSVFFYGLFMDINLLKEKGLHPTEPIPGYAEGYQLQIGERATLIKSPGRRAYGAVMALDAEALDQLYGEPGVVDYRAENITVTTFDHALLQVVVYNLPKEKLAGKNSNYAAQLAKTARDVGLPQAYIQEIETFTR